ncbi:MAG: family 10 glycosylhydrolase [Clostridiales bacterium]|nr:family 10 glycosylhydrolase [Clostridiales bacterium]
MSKMDRKTFIIVTSICAAFVLIFALAIFLVLLTWEKDTKTGANLGQDEVAGVWIASVTNIDFPSSPNLDADTLRGEIDAIVENTASLGLNTIYFQVRPCADALYDSDIFPVSIFLSESGELQLDALEYMVETAHAAGISVHAWVNPLRVTTGGVSTEETLSEDHPAVQHPEWVVEYADGRLYFDCGVPQVRELAAAGVEEIV